ncbi:interleukin-27 subunit alpha isoform X2 [Anolis carolinensis]|uniref:interleukin-27 subunit alpha isoform X2 n=1 Tax=Anolis carolinensis TaxID=28377 RepID=UPI000462D574|nr:PREDICTED: interleukin-27 subunit alpha isoform X2 [Anolis carolinensis]|eukprot:XP_008115728.1 PREDICTED: interleukin-27 subunit alpha isoform X2 [Anolis carolinensis]
MRLCGAAFLLQILFSVDLLVAAVPVGLRGEKASGLKSSSEWRANLQKELGSSLKLSRQLLCKTRNLKHLYQSERLPGAHLFLIPHSRRLPSPNLNLSTWLALPDAKRLSHMAEGLSFYQTLVQQLRDHEATKEDFRLLSQLEDLRCNLRDLSHHVSYQISRWELPFENHLEPALQPPQILQHQNQWSNRQEVYLVLRYLENFLCRVTRDFVMLRARLVKGTFLSRGPRTPSSHSISS